LVSRNILAERGTEEEKEEKKRKGRAFVPNGSFLLTVPDVARKLHRWCAQLLYRNYPSCSVGQTPPPFDMLPYSNVQLPTGSPHTYTHTHKNEKKSSERHNNKQPKEKKKEKKRESHQKTFPWWINYTA
jgi:hypothetical protein